MLLRNILWSKKEFINEKNYLFELLLNVYLSRSEVDKAFKPTEKRQTQSVKQIKDEIFGEQTGFFECFVPTPARRKPLFK